MVIGTFLSVPAISSVISTIHLIDLFNLGNPTWLSILLAVTFELGSIASLLAISVIDKIKTGAIWFIFFILSALQIIGNVYYSYSFTSDQILSNPTFLTNFMDLFSFITGDEIRDVKIFLSCIIGIPIPLIALFFLKSNIDYLKPKKEEDIVNDNIKQEKEEQPEIEQPAIEQLEIEQAVQAKDTKDEEITEEDPSLDDYVVINPEIEETTENQMEMHESEEYLRDQIEKMPIRSPKPMISQRRNDALTALHRG